MSKLILDLDNIIINYCSSEDMLIYSDYVNNGKMLYYINNKSINQYVLNGWLLSLHYIFNSKPIIYNCWFMDKAAGYGYVEMLYYLHAIGQTCSPDAMDLASKYGQFEIVRFLNSIGARYSPQAIGNSSQNGHFNIVAYLYDSCKQDLYY